MVEGFDDASTETGVWRYEKASRVRVVVDGEDYFRLIQQAMLNARQRILLIGWDFDTRIHLERGRRWWQRPFKRHYPSRLGSFILWLNRHNKELEIRILKWSYGFIKFFGRGSMLIDVFRWWRHKRIDFKFDTAHPVACSHHQKIVVIDDRFAVCGGIDLTTHRWDTREHLEKDPRRKRLRGKQYGPWHDVTMFMEGEVAKALDQLGRVRWIRAGGTPLDPPVHAEKSAWPEGLEADFEDVEIGIARTRAEYGGDPKVDEIEELFVRQIRGAKKFIYAESQYFASRAIGEAIAERMAEEDPPEIIIVHPQNADGWVEEQAMDPARAQLVHAIREIDKDGRFQLYVPFTGETPIYVHAKLMIVDDRILRVGSANFNNRSMGLDSECDVFVDCSRPGNSHCGERIRFIRHNMLAEHCGIEPDEVERLIEEHGSMAAMIESLGTSRSRQLRRFDPPEISEALLEMADRQVFDPEEPEELFEIREPGRGLFREGSLLARAKRRFERRKLLRKKGRA